MKAADARVLLTGASGGIGRAVATALRDAGAAVMLSSRSPAGLALQAQALTGGNDEAVGVAVHAADLTRSEDVAALSAAARAWGANVVVHNAGVPSFGTLESLRPETIVHALHTNLLAPVLLTRALLPHLRRQPRAQVICMGSALGRIGLPGFSVYSAGKFGLRGFAEALRRELGDGPVKVQYLGPRSTRTAFNNAAVEAYNRATGTAMDTPERVAAALLRLLEDEVAERYLGFPERLAVRINGFAAPLLDRSFARHRRSLPAAPADLSSAEPDGRPMHTPS